MKRLKSLILKDIALTSKNYFFYVTLFFAVLMILVINFAIPEDTTIETVVYVVVEYDADQALLEAYEQAQVVFVEDRQVLDEMLKDNIQSIGIILIADDQVEYRLQGHENQGYRDLLALNGETMYGEYGDRAEVSTTALKDYDVIEAPPFNKLLLPMFHVMEPALLGLFLIATMIFSEKEENTLTAFATTPGHIHEFILSKTLVMTLLGLVSLMLTSLAVLGFKANYLWLILLTIVCSFMGSAFGLLLASFFKNITGAMMWIILLSIVMTLPFVTYIAPGFSPLWVKLLPTYYMLFAYKEAAFPTGNVTIIYQTLAMGTIFGGVAYVAALFRYRKYLKV